ncbi:unnamed protein product, partial [Coregonus sp. 'balchen']
NTPLHILSPVSSCSVAPASANQNASDNGVRGQLQQEDPASKGLPARFFIGVSLVVGFTLMFLVDQISSYCSIHDPQTGMSNRTSITATLGLVIHAAADGVALGAAVASSQVTVQVVVFLAVILHKCVVCFFPLLLQSGGSSQHRLTATGVGMLFSAGTFLYVATVHVLPEVSSRGQQQQSSSHLHLHGTGTGQPEGLGALESLTLILGAGLPVLLALGLHDD